MRQDKLLCSLSHEVEVSAVGPSPTFVCERLLAGQGPSLLAAHLSLARAPAVVCAYTVRMCRRIAVPIRLYSLELTCHGMFFSRDSTDALRGTPC